MRVGCSQYMILVYYIMDKGSDNYDGDFEGTGSKA